MKEMSHPLKHFIHLGLKEKYRNKYKNALCSLGIIGVVWLVLAASQGRNKSSKVNDAEFGLIGEDDLADFFPGERVNKIYYTPHTNLTEELMEGVRNQLYIVDERVVPVGKDIEMELILLGEQYNSFGVHFLNISANGHLDYVIRTRNNNFRTDETYSRDVLTAYKTRDNEYVDSGFLALQNAVDKSFLNLMKKQSEDLFQTIHLKYGHIPVDDSQGPQKPTQILDVILLLAVSFTLSGTYILLLVMVQDRAVGMREFLKLATPNSGWLEMALFVINFIQLLTVLLICIAIAVFGYGVWDDNPAQLFYLCILGVFFIANLIAFHMFLSTTLESSAIAAAVVPVVVFVPLLISSLSTKLIWMFLIFPANGLYYAGSIFHSFHSSGHAFELSSILTDGYPGVTPLNLLCVYLFQVIGTLVWLFLWFYVSNVFPGKYGTPKSKLFCLSERYLRSFSRLKRESLNQNRINTESQNELAQHLNGSNELGNRLETYDMEYMDQCPEPFEQLSEGKPVVQIAHLCKTFPGKNGAKVAVKDFSLKIYSHSITVLLGHNGAGKTTTMNIITGILPPTSGTVVVDGVSDVNQYRHKIGFCPQHDVFFSYLSCLEHLVFFGRLRGLQDDEAVNEAKAVLEKVNLLEKKDALVHTLSGGMKRRLSLAIAIVGHTKLLILDEPTSGLDPESRRDIWDILLKLRQDHTILLTTHFMEEAEVLGDWVAIMEEGKSIAFGSTMYLKQVYGQGYKLKLLKSNNFDQQATYSLIQQHIPQATERESVKEIFAVILPYGEMASYALMLKELEAKSNELGIASFSITNATLEEVFLNSSIRRKTIQHHPESVDTVDNVPNSHIVGELPKVQKEKRLTLLDTLNILFAIWGKKWIHVKSNKPMYGLLSALPLIVTILCLTVAPGTTDAGKALPAVKLDGSWISEPIGVLVVNRAPDSDRNKAFQDIKAIQADFERYPVNGVRMRTLENIALEDALRKMIANDYLAYRDRLVVGIECNVTGEDVQVTMLYNNNLLHSTGIGETVTTTLLLRYSAGVTGATVHTKNIPSTRTQLVNIQKPFYFTELIAIAFYFYMLMFLQVPLQERLSGFRQLQNVNKPAYWGSTYAFDLLVHLIECVAVLVLVYTFDRPETLDDSSRFHIFWTLFLYGVIALPVVYIFSQCVESINTAITIMGYMMIFGVTGVLLLSNGYDDVKNNNVPIMFFHIVPEFALKHSLRVVYENQKSISYERSLIEQNKGGVVDHTFANERIAPNILYILSLFHVAIMTACLLLIDDNNRRENFKHTRESVADNMRKIYRRKNSSEQTANDRGFDETDSPLREDVKEESRKVEDLLDGGTSSDESKKQYAIRVHSLKKSYSKHQAVKSISFAVKKGECFGLLGLNGAGKTTVFQMLSRNLPLTEGKVYLQDCEVKQTNEHEYRNQYGYCPQYDVLLDFMTVFEVIDYFARIKGLEARESTIAGWLAQLDIQEYRDHMLRDCSGGTKRKVNTILALLGGPSVVLLDEPTTGVDPKSRHFLWKTIKKIQEKDQTILLTSHSMDECEELCNRLSIMVNGQLSCIGTIPQLKKTHGQGYNLWIKLNISIVDRTAAGEDNDSEEFIQEVKQRFNATLQEKHKGLFRFVVGIALWELFARTVSLKDQYGGKILYFSINESSLEDVFLKFRPKDKQHI